MSQFGQSMLQLCANRRQKVWFATFIVSLLILVFITLVICLRKIYLVSFFRAFLLIGMLSIPLILLELLLNHFLSWVVSGELKQCKVKIMRVSQIGSPRPLSFQTPICTFLFFSNHVRIFRACLITMCMAAIFQLIYLAGIIVLKCLPLPHASLIDAQEETLFTEFKWSTYFLAQKRRVLILSIILGIAMAFVFISIFVFLGIVVSFSKDAAINTG